MLEEVETSLLKTLGYDSPESVFLHFLIIGMCLIVVEFQVQVGLMEELYLIFQIIDYLFKRVI